MARMRLNEAVPTRDRFGPAVTRLHAHPHVCPCIPPPAPPRSEPGRCAAIGGSASSVARSLMQHSGANPPVRRFPAPLPRLPPKPCERVGLRPRHRKLIRHGVGPRPVEGVATALGHTVPATFATSNRLGSVGNLGAPKMPALRPTWGARRPRVRPGNKRPHRRQTAWGSPCGDAGPGRTGHPKCPPRSTRGAVSRRAP